MLTVFNTFPNIAFFQVCVSVTIMVHTEALVTPPLASALVNPASADSSVIAANLDSGTSEAS